MDISPKLSVDDILAAFVETELLPGLNLKPAEFWSALERILADFTPRNAAQLARRDDLQTQIDAWWRARKGKAFDIAEETAFLESIGYLLPEPPPFEITTAGVDPEIARLAGPQLVVPVSNGRFALNAANARWGSLYDALYGTDALEPPTGGKGYDPVRGAKVIGYARQVLDKAAPLSTGSHADATAYLIGHGGLIVRLKGGQESVLADPGQFVGYQGEPAAPSAVLIRHHDLHLEIQVDRSHSIGKDDPAGVADVLVEAALTTIQDCEDSVAAVDAEDKAGVYRNWLGLMRGDLTATFAKGGASETRRLAEDRRYSTLQGPLTLRGRSLMLVRNVGHHMLSDAALYEGHPVFETVLDALITVTAALHDLRGAGKNSPAGSVYVVKPKMHGPDEVALAVRLFDLVEDALGLTRNTVKLGIMDEERRTSANLAAADRVHQHRLPGPHGRRDPHRDGSRPRGAQGGDPRRTLAARLREAQRRDRPGRGLPRPRPDRQGHVGRAGPDGRHARRQGRPPEGRGQHGLGALAHGGRAARPALPRCGRCGGAGDHGPERREDRNRCAADPASGPVELERGRRSGGARQQRPGHPGLCGPLDRPGRRLLQGAGHP